MISARHREQFFRCARDHGFVRLDSFLILHLLYNFQARERSPAFLRRATARGDYRVTKTGYAGISPSMTLANNRAWISSNRR